MVYTRRKNFTFFAQQVMFLGLIAYIQRKNP